MDPACVYVLEFWVYSCFLIYSYVTFLIFFERLSMEKCFQCAANSVTLLGKHVLRRVNAFYDVIILPSPSLPRLGFPEIKMCLDSLPYLLWKAEAQPNNTSFDPPKTIGMPPFSKSEPISAEIVCMHSSAAFMLFLSPLNWMLPQSLTFTFYTEMPYSGLTIGPTLPKNLLKQHGPRSYPLFLMHLNLAKENGAPTKTTSPSDPSFMIVPMRKSSMFITYLSSYYRATLKQKPIKHIFSLT